MADSADAAALRKEVEARERLRVAERQAAEQLERDCRARVAQLTAAGRWSGTWRAVVALLGGGLLGAAAGWVAATARTPVR